MALRSINQVCTLGPGIQTSGGVFQRNNCQQMGSAAQFPQLRDGKVEDGYQVAALRGGAFSISGPGFQRPTPFNPQQTFQHPATGQVIYKHETGVLTGISSILGPLASAGANIFSNQQRINLQRARMEQGGGQSFAPPPQQFVSRPPQKSNTGLIIGVVVALVVVGGFVMMNSSKDD